MDDFPNKKSGPPSENESPAKRCRFSLYRYFTRLEKYMQWDKISQLGLEYFIALKTHMNWFHIVIAIKLNLEI